jgi:hypothetical protein
MLSTPSRSETNERADAALSRRSRVDGWGIFASCLCAVHCAAGALVVGVTGVTGSLLRDERVELFFLLATVSLASASVTLGYRQHQNARVALLAVAGLSLLGAARALPAPLLLEPAASVLGASLLVMAHVLNARLLHRVGACSVRNRCKVAA